MAFEFEKEMLGIYNDNLDLVGEYIETRRGRTALCPERHQLAAAHLEVVIDQNGTFKGASVIPDVESITIIPTTFDSCARTSNSAPHGLNDNLSYVASDLCDYLAKMDPKGEGETEEEYQKRCAKHEKHCAKKNEHHADYMKQLKTICAQDDAPDAFKAVLLYLSNGSKMIADLISVSPEVAEVVGITEAKQDLNLSTFIRFKVLGLPCENTWEDKKLFDWWIKYCRHLDGIEIGDIKNKGAFTVKSISHEIQVCCSKWPSYILGKGIALKLYSSNDKTGFTYRGRIDNPSVITRIGRSDAYRIHAAVRWLMDLYGKRIGSYYLVVYNKLNRCGENLDVDPTEMREDAERTRIEFNDTLSGKTVVKRNVSEDANDAIVVFGLREVEPADGGKTPGKGRVALVYYGNMSKWEYAQSIKEWFGSYGWSQISPIKGGFESYTGIPGVNELIRFIYGREDATQNMAYEMNSGISRFRQELMQSMLYGDRVPDFITNQAVIKAAKPCIFKRRSNYERMLNIACALIAKRRRINDMGNLNEDFNDRSYLFGRMTAMVQWAERSTYSAADADRASNAEKMLKNMMQAPASTWRTLYGTRFQPYLRKMKPASAAFYRKMIDELVSRIDPAEFNNRSCSNLFLLGYSAQMNWFRDRVSQWKESKDANNDTSESEPVEA